MGSSPFDLSSILNTCGPLTSAELNVAGNPVITPYANTSDQPVANNGLLGSYAGWIGNTYMDFATLSNPTLRNTWLERRYNHLKGITYVSNGITYKIIPSNPNLDTVASSLSQSPSVINPVADYNTEIVNFLKIIAKEFCFYQKNYFIALNKFLAEYATTSGGAGGTDLNNAQRNALLLNQKVNTHISMVYYLSNKNIANLTTLESQISSLNGNIATSTANLKKQADILTNYNKSNDLFRQMTEYTEEKNRANKNLIAVYFTLNVVAIASLFIIARSL
jgi:hypothetical protein